MRNRRLVLLILISLLCYIFLQCTLYAVSQRRELLSHALHSPQYHHGQEEDHLFSLENVRDYVDLCHQFGIQVILVDPNVLRLAAKQQQAENGTCQYFCAGNAVTELAVRSHLWTHDVSLLDRIKEEGFTVAFFTEKNVEVARFLSLGVKREIYTHYLYQRNGHTIHQVILYPRQPGYLWYAEFTDTGHTEGGDAMAMQTAFAQTLSYFGRHAGVLESFEMIKVSMDGIRLRVPRYPSKMLQALADDKFIQCNYTRADSFHSLYSHHGNREEEDSVKQFREANRRILTQAKRVLDRLGVRFWLSSGTCLGWYRQCDTIHYSGDVDIGVWISDYNKQLVAAMTDSGLSLKHVFGKISDSYELSFENNHVKLDIFFFYEEGNYMWNGGTQARTGQKFKYMFPRFTLCWTEFLGLKVRVPCETDQYLEANYGPDWFVPVESWDWKSSPPNVVANGYWPQEEWSQVIMIFDNV